MFLHPLIMLSVGNLRMVVHRAMISSLTRGIPIANAYPLVTTLLA